MSQEKFELRSFLSINKKPESAQPPNVYQRLRTLTSLLFCLLAFACGHSGIKEATPDHSQKTLLAWHGKALIFDKVKDKKNTVTIDAISRRPRSMRIDLSATLGIYVGSFVWNDSQMQVLLAREKKFITGPANAESMQELLKMQIDPVALLDIFWDEALPRAEWTCTVGPIGQMKTCQHKNLPINVTWQERDGRHRLIEIDSPKVNTQLSLNELEEDVVLKPDSFQLKAPESYRMINLKSN